MKTKHALTSNDNSWGTLASEACQPRNDRQTRVTVEDPRDTVCMSVCNECMSECIECAVLMSDFEICLQVYKINCTPSTL